MIQFHSILISNVNCPSFRGGRLYRLLSSRKIGYLPMNRREANLFFQVVSAPV